MDIDAERFSESTSALDKTEEAAETNTAIQALTSVEPW